jgi:hypothetical protein
MTKLCRRILYCNYEQTNVEVFSDAIEEELDEVVEG